jgi:glycosyltransferase involved in cell wall biosynthesis
MYNWQTRKDFRDLLIKINPNIVHTHVFTGFSSSVWHETVRQGIPLVHTLRDYNLLCVLSTLYKDNVECKRRCTQCRAVTLAKKYFSQKVDAVVGISQYILSKHLELGYFRRSCIQTVIPNSVKTPTKLQQTLKSRTIGFLGRVHPSKGVELLIESFLQLKKNEYDLKIAGEGDDFYIDKLRTKYPSERIHFLGKVDAYSFLSNISLLVVPSLWNEPFGRVIVEANTCGVPVLVSNRGGMPELVKDGVNGCVFKLEKEDDLKCQLSRMIDIIDMFDTQGTEMNAYKQETVADRYLDIYSHLLK